MYAVQSPWDNNSIGMVVDIECYLSNGLPGITIIDPHESVDEAKERLGSPFASSKLATPRKRVAINLAPADISKESTTFDIPVVAAILTALPLLVR